MSTTPLPHRALRFPLAPHHNAFVCSHHPCVPPPRSHRATSSPTPPASTTTTTTLASFTHSAPPPPPTPPTPPPLLRPTLTAVPPPRFRSMTKPSPRSALPAPRALLPTPSTRVCPPCPSPRHHAPRSTSVPAHDVLPAATLPRPFRHELSDELSWRRGQECRDAFGSVCAQRRKGNKHAQRTCL